MPSPSSRPIKPSDSQANSTDKSDSKQFIHNQNNPSTFKAQYNAFLGSPKYRAYKQQKGIDGHIYILNANAPIFSLPPTYSTTQHIFSAFYDLPVQYSESTIQAFLALDNKNDTLTQSHMLKAHDSAQFIACQIPEIRGLENIKKFQYRHISELPPRARLLSSIWSYHCKRHPNGDLLKHKARICVADLQQLHGRDYWETYAPVISWSTV